MNSKIIVDYREKSIIENLQASTKLKSHLDIQNLDVSDIILQHKEFRFLIERKSISDLICSIKDGRYKEQKMRLLSTKHQHPFTSICYILEGAPKFRNLKMKTYIMVLGLALTLRDKIPVFRTSSMNETIGLVVRLFMRLQKEPEQFFPTLPEISLSNSLNSGTNSESNSETNSLNSTTNSIINTEINVSLNNETNHNETNYNENSTNKSNIINQSNESNYRTIQLKPGKGSKGSKKNKKSNTEDVFTVPLSQETPISLENNNQNINQNVKKV